MRSENDHQGLLPEIEELPYESVPVSTQYKPETPSRKPSVNIHESPSPPFAAPAFSRSNSPAPPQPPPLPSSVPSSLVRSPASNSIRAVAKQSATLIPPSQIKFQSVQIQWKGLPLEAALCEFCFCTTRVDA